MTDTAVPPIRFAPARGARIAYQIYGEGPPTIVSIPPAAQNIEMAWERAEVRAMLERFGHIGRFLHFDKRGTGASDRSLVNGIDERVDDLRAVMDHAGVDRAHIFAASEGGPMAILFSLAYPERVQSLILNGAYAVAYPEPLSDEELAEDAARRERYVSVWGTDQSPVVDGFAPSLAGDPSFREWHQRYERQSASADSLRDLLEMLVDLDVREALPLVTAPTLVLHRTGDRIVSVERAYELANGIPGARLVELPGDDHFGYAGDMESWMAEIAAFVGSELSNDPGSSVDAPSVRINALGRFAVEIDGVEVATSEWGSRRARVLLKRLVAARGWPVTRDELIDILWPDETDMRRLGSRLSVLLSTVRRILRGGIVADRQTVRLDLDAVAVDLEEFFKATNDPAIVAAYPGDLLPEDLYEDWAAPARDDARARFLTAARLSSRSDLESGSLLRAEWTARRIVDIDRYDDEGYRLLFAVLTRAGRLGEASRAYERYSTAMADLDIEVPPFDRIGDS